jgi:hypothetical protein
MWGIKSKMKWADNMACMRKKINACIIFVRRSERKRLFEFQEFDSRIIIGDQLSRNWKEFCELYHLTRCRDEWRTLLTRIMNFVFNKILRFWAS